MTVEQFAHQLATSTAYRDSIAEQVQSGTLSEETELLLWALADDGPPDRATVTDAPIVDDAVNVAVIARRPARVGE
jgi:hypothetical protein